MTSHCEYMARVIRQTVDKEMRDEASILRDHYLLREAIKNIVEGPDADIDRIIRSIHQSGEHVSNKLLKQYPLLADEAILKEIVEVVQRYLR